MKDLHDVIRLKEEQVAQLEKELAALRMTAKILAESPRPLSKKEKAGKGVSLPTGTVVTQPLMIRSVLIEGQQPMHVDAISEAIKKKFAQKLEPQYLTSIIYRLMKKGKLFYKSKQNTFGLLEWPSGSQSVVAEHGARVQ